MDAMKGAFLGPEFSEKEAEAMAKEQGAVYRKMESRDTLVEATARLISEGMVVGWFQGRMEFGPRALGARSILADARNPEMQKKLNLAIKNREGFRPFAPAVMAEDVQDYFDAGGRREAGRPGRADGRGEAGCAGDDQAEREKRDPFISPYMLLVKGIKESRRHPLPEGYAGRNMTDKLNFVRSDLPSITHVDYSARVQTVHRETNPLFWLLLRSFKELTGCAVLINTSFNVRDEPIVNTPQEAFRCLMQTEMDCLVIGNLIFDKSAQGR
jgi:carbamoyltransferase